VTVQETQVGHAAWNGCGGRGRAADDKSHEGPASSGAYEGARGGAGGQEEVSGGLGGAVKGGVNRDGCKGDGVGAGPGALEEE
jgi:hypothetical protein